MIPFDKIYTWLFKSFNISGETELIERLMKDGYTHMMIIKRSWIFALFLLWIPIVILTLSGISIWIAYDSIDIIAIKYTLISGNILMSLILVISTVTYIRHFRKIHREPVIETDTKKLVRDLTLWDNHFRSFFNWSITNQFILVGIIFAEIVLLLLYGKGIGEHFWILATDTFVILLEIFFLRHFRRRMMDLEMDYNIIVPGKIFFVNQSGVLSAVQTIESDKIKTVQSSFPSKIASFFNFGTVHVLTEGDTQAMMGTMSMYYVTNPDGVVANIQTLLDEKLEERKEKAAAMLEEVAKAIHPIPETPKTQKKESQRHSLDTREKIRAVIHK
jgi:hypothetical protein